MLQINEGSFNNRPLTLWLNYDSVPSDDMKNILDYLEKKRNELNGSVEEKSDTEDADIYDEDPIHSALIH